MAVVFISPKKRQKTFFMWISGGFVLLLIFISLAVFLSKPPEVQPELVFNKPKVTIDFSILDSEKFKNLEPLMEMLSQYRYTATTSKGKPVEGVVSATSVEDAKRIIESRSLLVSNIKEVQIGRDNPFSPYYVSTLPAAPKK
jgi:hypothetical protein